ncbi:hypothetical protein CRENBAI_011363 [Crenichthys baileyi]|uniref:Uncharacterized protein n=1 Tax=Crenichthys baileyi TaxID=28760 RepID=A0AAV9RAW3_9TELE
MDLVDSRPGECHRDRWVQQQMEEAMKNLPTDLEVLLSPLLLEQMEREAAQRQRVREDCSFPPPQLRRSLPVPVPAAKPSSSSRRKKRRRGAPSCGSAGEEVVYLPADVRAAACKPASSSQHCLPGSLPVPARCSEATPDELEQRLRFYTRQIKSFRTTSLIYSSPELMERIRQMERDYETAVRQFYCRPPLPMPHLQDNAAAQSTSGLQSAAAEQPTSCLQTAAAAAEQATPGLQGAAATEQLTPGLQNASAAAAEQSTSGFLIAAAAAQLTSCLLTAAAVEQSTPGLQPAAEFPEGPMGGLPPLPRHVPEGPIGGLPPRPGPEHLLVFALEHTELMPDS